MYIGRYSLLSVCMWQFPFNDLFHRSIQIQILIKYQLRLLKVDSPEEATAHDSILIKDNNNGKRQIIV